MQIAVDWTWNSMCRFFTFFMVCLLFIPNISKDIFARPQNSKIVTLKEAVNIALENNASLLSARQALHTSKHSFIKAKFDLLAKADILFNYARLDPGTV